MTETAATYTAFIGHRCLGSGGLEALVRAIKTAQEQGDKNAVLIFDDDSKPVEVDLRGSLGAVLKRLPAAPAIEAAPEKSGRGRPKLGVVAREVTLLPRHWEWLNQQPGGASVALRKLVEEARRLHLPRDRARRSQESAYRFMAAMAGNLPDYEEALRAFYAGNKRRFNSLVATWPDGVRDHAKQLAGRAFVDAAAVETAAVDTADAKQKTPG